jgi:hypothetical protein
MSEIRAEEAQSFLLRFWYERSLIEAGHWRGTLSYQKLDPDEEPRPVDDPEEAFEFVRHALARVTPHGTPTAPAGQATARIGTTGHSVPLCARLVRAFRRMFGRDS